MWKGSGDMAKFKVKITEINVFYHTVEADDIDNAEYIAQLDYETGCISTDAEISTIEGGVEFDAEKV